MPIPHLAPTASGEDIAAVLASDGAVVVDRLADPTLMDRVRAELSPFMAATRTGSDEFSGHRTRRTVEFRLCDFVFQYRRLHGQGGMCVILRGKSRLKRT